ncbi:MAG: tetratricopeptide repeat protein [Candidatus Thiodiazotropha sp. (ex Lucinoma borealis)]|nr:tetratricopeptide repeat protein [Candidatus Thiodiazotropha sp. (ex Lucinoma borealis)]MCU7870501.1 tetratricopeptide repeat protein [Candidatus Thiodiazotropha sp. (ex Lucinoma borealis)]
MSNNLSRANKKLNQGKLAEAYKLLSRALKKDPSDTRAQYLLGDCLIRQDRIEEAINHLKKATSGGNTEPCIFFLCGVALQKVGQFLDAKKSYDLAERSGCTENLMYYMIGSYHANISKDFTNAEIYFARTITNNPNAYVAYVALSKLYNDQGRYEEAIQTLDYCLTHDYETVEVYVNLGLALSHQGRQEEALACCKKSVEMAPENAIAKQNYLTQLLFSIDDETVIYPEIQKITKSLNAHSKIKYDGKINCQTDRKIKLGFVSADFRKHAISHYFLPILRHLNRDKFSVYLYYNNTIHDQMTDSFNALSDTWCNCILLKDKQLENKIRSDNIDILIDLSNNTAGNRLTAFLNKPAPMQVSLMGLPMSTGLDCMDYAVRDQYTAEKCHLNEYSSEKILPIENSAFFDPLIDLPPISAPPCIKNGYITFGSFNGLRKIDKNLMGVWAKLLHSLPGSMIKLMTDDYMNSFMKDYLYDIFAQFDVEKSRLILQPRLPIEEFLASHNEVDIALDAYPCHGESTSYHSLLMGLPLVSRTGRSCTSNASNRILSAINRQHWVANDFDQYIDIALSLAHDVDSLISNRKNLRTEIENSSLMDFKRITENIESALMSGWRTLCENQNQG